MAIEKSAGAVIFRKKEGRIFYLLIRYETGHWEFPKGNLEKGESWQEAAEREVKEETALKDMKFISGFREVIKYFYKKDSQTILKIVTFFLAEVFQTGVVLSFEHKDHRWLPYKEALRLITYQEAQEVLKKADHFIRGNLLYSI